MPTSALRSASSRSSHVDSSTDPLARSAFRYPEKVPRVFPIRSRRSGGAATVVAGSTCASEARQRCSSAATDGWRSAGAVLAHFEGEGASEGAFGGGDLAVGPLKRRHSAASVEMVREVPTTNPVGPKRACRRAAGRRRRRRLRSRGQSFEARLPVAPGAGPGPYSVRRWSRVRRARRQAPRPLKARRAGGLFTFWLTTLEDPPGVMVTP